MLNVIILYDINTVLGIKKPFHCLKRLLVIFYYDCGL